MALGLINPSIQWVPTIIYGPGMHPAPNSVGTEDNLWSWGPLRPEWVPNTIYSPGAHPAPIQWVPKALGPTQPPIQWVPKTIYGPWSPHSPQFSGYQRPWGPLSPQFSGFQRQFMALGPIQPPIRWVPKALGPTQPLIHWVLKTIYGPGTHPASDPVSKCAPFHAMKTYNPCTRWRWMVNLKPQPCFPREWHSSHRIGGSVEYRDSANILEKVKLLAPTRILIPDYLPIA